MRVRSLVFILLVVSSMLLLVAGCSRDATPPADTSSDQVNPPVFDITITDLVVDADGDEIVAFVNAVPVSRNDFERGKQLLYSRYQPIYAQIGLSIESQLEGAQGRLFELRIEDEALEMATTRALIAEELNRRNATVSDTDVDAEFQRQYAQLLAALGMSEQELKDAFDAGELAGVEIGDLTFNQFIANTKQTIREELESQAAQRVIAGPIDHAEEQLIAFFEQHRSDYDTPEQVRVSHILVETEARARQGLAVLGAGGIFSDLAREISIDTDTSERGGDLGWFGRGQLAAPFEYAAFATPVGEVSGIIRTEFGYHIILVTDYQPEHMPQYEDVADLVASDFDALAVEQRFEEWYTAARVAAIISIQDLMLDAFRKQQEDVDQGLQAYLRLRDEDMVDDPYLDYIIGTIYEIKMDEAQSRRLGIASGQQEQIDALDAEIETNRSQALASYRAALSQLEDNAEIDARIKSLESSL